MFPVHPNSAGRHAPRVMRLVVDDQDGAGARPLPQPFDKLRVQLVEIDP